MSFASLGLSEPLVRAVTELGYTQPTPIQLQAIPAVLSGGDLLAGAQTGTGKTAGFTLPLLQRLSTTPAVKPRAGGKRAIRALVLAPTRELAAQVEESVRQYSRYLKMTSMTVFGGVNINPQIRQLQDGVDILVATPGRLLDHVGQNTVDLSSVEILVLDEADRMLDMGFIRDIRKILALLPAKRQNLLFSATFSDDIRKLADGLLNRPALIEVARRNAAAESVDQKIILVDKQSKRALLSKLIKDNNWYQVLVFTRTKHGANRLAELLNKDGITALAIHGNKSQSARTRALSGFKDGSLQVLVATDIAARGLDIAELPHVVNFELPNVSEDYVHRIGRTGRAGATGEAISLVCVDEHKFLADIERLLKRSLPRIEVPGFEPDLSIKPVPIPMGRSARGQQYDDGLGESTRPPLPAGGRGGRPGQRPGQGGRPGQGAQSRQGASGSGQRSGQGGHGAGQRAGQSSNGAPQRPASGAAASQRPGGGASRPGAGGHAAAPRQGHGGAQRSAQPGFVPGAGQSPAGQPARPGESAGAAARPAAQVATAQPAAGTAAQARTNPTASPSTGFGFRGTTTRRFR